MISKTNCFSWNALNGNHIATFADADQVDKIQNFGNSFEIHDSLPLHTNF